MSNLREQQKSSHPRIAFVTGATRGLGHAIAQELSKDHHIIVGGTSDNAAEVAELFPSAEPFIADLANLEEVRAKVAELDLQSVDVIVHAAGVVAHKATTETAAEEWQGAFDVNFFAVAELTQLLLPALQATGGTLVAMNSGAGYHSGDGYGPYATTKHALKAYTDALREEQRGSIRVTSIHPGKADSDMQREIQAERGNEYDASQFIKPESIAQAVRLAVDLGDDAVIEELAIRPANGK
ncbi:SDR family oxidoreductase [Corynebacterium suicordis]|uniref:SDR family oxidoreductase n=1 Tax=Corynebacterium suicordis DSM 45110 TaxID=1121369 RepID=A0ABR9ZI86_9CORY|nr:SDR family oxidoreductase [Corynebacterium suicordis]MBF4553156.1 SDR family oxidoreductase [Corynebacterium suicordis DSM 45110]MDR6277881.1 NADP-dependent 3-hydroxy acid dehydrogenase YdfG [Corynebacterium suicordis]